MVVLKRVLRFLIYLAIGFAGAFSLFVVLGWLVGDLDNVFSSYPIFHTIFKAVPLVVIGTAWVLSGKHSGTKKSR